MLHFSALDKFICNIDRWLRPSNKSQVILIPRPTPALSVPESNLSKDEQQLSIAMMRVNHSGEVCAQALYQGQAYLARSKQQYNQLLQAANEEQDHLNWCKQRLEELNAHPSIFNPIWYMGSFALGALAGVAGDKISLGFLAETERQVTQHLEKHLSKISAADYKSRAILQQMRIDEMQHAEFAVNAGAATLPLPIKVLMRCTAKIMTTAAAKI